MKKTVEQLANEGTDIMKCIREETLLLHSQNWDRNTCEARIICTLDLPDGRVMQVNRVVRLRFTEGA